MSDYSAKSRHITQRGSREQEFITFLLDRACPAEVELVTNEWHEDGTEVVRKTFLIDLCCQRVEVTAERNPDNTWSLIKWNEYAVLTRYEDGVVTAE